MEITYTPCLFHCTMGNLAACHLLDGLMAIFRIDGRISFANVHIYERGG